MAERKRIMRPLFLCKIKRRFSAELALRSRLMRIWWFLFLAFDLLNLNKILDSVPSAVDGCSASICRSAPGYPARIHVSGLFGLLCLIIPERHPSD
jgi:hypothetical protein